MSNIFETKEEYLEFRAKWRQLYKDGFHKPQPVPQTTGWGTYKKIVGYHQISPMNVVYHLTFNAILGREMGRGFNRASRSKLGSKDVFVTDDIFVNLGIVDPAKQKIIKDRIVAFLKNLP